MPTAGVAPGGTWRLPRLGPAAPCFTLLNRQLLLTSPPHTPTPSHLQSAPLRTVTVKDAIGDLPIIKNGHNADTMAYSGEAVSAYQKKIRNGAAQVRLGRVECFAGGGPAGSARPTGLACVCCSCCLLLLLPPQLLACSCRPFLQARLADLSTPSTTRTRSCATTSARR